MAQCFLIKEKKKKGGGKKKEALRPFIFPVSNQRKTQYVHGYFAFKIKFILAPITSNVQIKCKFSQFQFTSKMEIIVWFWKPKQFQDRQS